MRAREGGITMAKSEKKKAGSGEKAEDPGLIEELGEYIESYRKVDPVRQLTARKLIGELRFMEKQLKILKADIEANGAVDNFVQGKQSMLRESPAMKSYCTLVARYGEMARRFADLLPEKKDTQKQVAGENLVSFLQQGKK